MNCSKFNIQLPLSPKSVHNHKNPLSGALTSQSIPIPWRRARSVYCMGVSNTDRVVQEHAQRVLQMRLCPMLGLLFLACPAALHNHTVLPRTVFNRLYPSTTTEHGPPPFDACPTPLARGFSSSATWNRACCGASCLRSTPR